MMQEFYDYYKNLFDRLYQALTKEFLIDLLSSENFGSLKPIGFSFFVGLKEDNVILVDVTEDGNKIIYKDFYGCPIRRLNSCIDFQYIKQRDCLYAMVNRVFPAFWKDLGILISNMKPINLDMFQVNTPIDIVSVSIRDENLMIYTRSLDKPIIYSIKRLPNEWEILQEIKKRFLQ